ncbi:hypothetical protein CR513_62697, partial [Mucuna pruriens]
MTELATESKIFKKIKLVLLHIDLFGSTRTTFMKGKCCGLVVVDDYSKWIWFKNEKILILLLSKLTMKENLKMKTFKSSMKNMTLLKKTSYELWKDRQSNNHTFTLSNVNIKEHSWDTQIRPKLTDYISKTLIVEKSIHSDKELLKLNNFIVDLNLEDLQTLSKELYLDKDLKDDKPKSSSRN